MLGMSLSININVGGGGGLVLRLMKKLLTDRSTMRVCETNSSNVT